MGTVAPPHSWDPEDDLLLKNAVEAIILMDGDGSFSLKNLGRFALVVNGKDLLKGQSCTLRSGSLIEIRGMWFILEVNPDSVRQFLLKTSTKGVNGRSLNLYSFKRELS